MTSQSSRRLARPYKRDADDTQPLKSAVNAWIADVAAQARASSRSAESVRISTNSSRSGSVLSTATDQESVSTVTDQQQANCNAPRPEPPAWALVLESRHLLTLAALCAADSGVEQATTVIPNPDPEELEAICTAAPDVITFPLTSHAFFASLMSADSPCRAALLRRGWAGTFDVVWMDYCGTLGAAARAGRQRQQDIESLFDQELLTTPLSVLAVTFTTRGSTELFHGELMEYLVLLADGCAMRNGRRALLLGVASYHNHISVGREARGPPAMHTATFAIAAQTASENTAHGFECALKVCHPPVLQVDGLQYTSGDVVRAQILSRTHISRSVSTDTAIAYADKRESATPLWSAVQWTAIAFAAGLSSSSRRHQTQVHLAKHLPEPDADAASRLQVDGTVVVVESSPLLLVSNFLTASSSALIGLPVVRMAGANTKPGQADQPPTAAMAVACARRHMQLEHQHHPSDELQSTSMRDGQLQQVQPNIGAALEQPVCRDLVGAWLGYDGLDSSAGSGGKPWRLEQLRRGEGPQALWDDLHRLLSSELLLSNQHHSQQGQLVRTFCVGVSLRYSSTGEVWEGAAVDNLLHGLSVAVARDGWRLESVGWVVTYAVTSPRLACLVYLQKDVSSSPGTGTAAVVERSHIGLREVRPICCGPAATYAENIPTGSTADALYTDEFAQCQAIDAECFQEQLDQCTPLEELRLMHNPARGQYIEVCCNGGDVGASHRIIGFVAYECRGDAAHILILAVTRGARRCGVARSLVDAVLRRARFELRWSCRLEVREDNLGACAFYRRAGFEQVGGPHPDYYADGGTALKLSRQLLPPEGLQRARTSLFWYRQELLPELQASGLTSAEISVQVAARWRQLKQEQPEIASRWEGIAEADRQRFEKEARVAAEALRIAQDETASASSCQQQEHSCLGSSLACHGNDGVSLASTCVRDFDSPLLSRVCQTLVAPTVKQWRASWRGMSQQGQEQDFSAGARADNAWDVARAKQPTTSAEKFRKMMEMQIGPALWRFAARAESREQRLTVLLHEPGFHYCVPILRRGAEPCRTVELLCFAAADEVQAVELSRRQLPSVSNGRDSRLTSVELTSADALLVPGALAFVLLWEGGVASWDETFGPWLEMVLEGPRARIAAADGGAGVILWMSCESSAKPEESLSMLALLVLKERGLSAAGWAWRELFVSSVHSDSRRYVVAGLELYDTSPVAG